MTAIADVTKLVSPTASAAQSQTVPASANSSQKLAASQSPSTANIPQDTVNISTGAKAAQVEAVETPVQTAKEARSGDLQAQRLLAREAAARRTHK